MEVTAHTQPRTKAEWLATWQSSNRIPVPTKSGNIMDMMIVHLIEATAIDGIPVDLVVEARASKRGPLKRFAVVFSEARPRDDYPIPTLWICDGTGSWLSF